MIRRFVVVGTQWRLDNQFRWVPDMGGNALAISAKEYVAAVFPAGLCWYA